MSKLKILFCPDFDQNQYIENIYKIIESIDSVEITRVKNITPGLIKSGFKHYDVSVVHWLENWLVNEQNKRITWRSIMRFVVRFVTLKIISKKVIYVRHNIYPHSLSSKDGKVAQWFADVACRLADVCVIHSGHLNKKYVYVPHPLYKFDHQVELPQSAKLKQFVMFGRIIEYKAIDKVLQKWGEAPLLVAGSVGSKEYVEQLGAIKANRKLDNVSIDARFLSNEEAQLIVASSRGLILAHCEDDMIVSGSFFFAASLGVPVLAIKSPFLTWLKSEFNYTGLFIFDDLKDMVHAINRQAVDEVDRRKISMEAQNLFGDQTIKQTFEKLLFKSSADRLI